MAGAMVERAAWCVVQHDNSCVFWLAPVARYNVCMYIMYVVMHVGIYVFIMQI